MRLFAKFFPQEFKAFFSEREADFHFPPDGFFLTGEQRAWIEKECPDTADTLVTIHQVHGGKVIFFDKDFSGGTVPEADGIVTTLPRRALSIRTADCLPVFAVDPVRKITGLAHAGWRGSVKGIAGGMIDAFRRAGAKPSDILVGFGPAIRSCCYEVGPQFRESFAQVEERGGRLYLDLAAANREQLVEAGMSAEHITDCGLCTCCDEGFYSYRRQGDRAGRHLSWIMRD